jgi:hypothetical protein
MPYFNQSDVFKIDKPIFAFSEDNFATHNVTVFRKSSSGAGVLNYIGLNEEDRRSVPEGMFVCEMTNSDIRFLPRGEVKAAVSTASPTISMSPWNIFAVGDVLSVVEPYVVLTVTASAATQTQTITINGQTATATASSATVATTASEIAAAINAHPYLKTIVFAKSRAGEVYIFSYDGVTLWGVTEGGTVTATLSAATMSYNATAIGTIASINNNTQEVTLAANATANLPIGTHLQANGISTIYGLAIHSYDFDIPESQDIALFTQSNGVREQFLPYLDGDIKRRLPGLNFGIKF